MADLVANGLIPVRIAENPAFRKIIEDLNSEIVVPSRTKLTGHIKLHSNKIKDDVLLPATEKSLRGSLMLDLWMSRANQDVLALVYNEVDENFRQGNLCFSWYHVVQ